MALDTYTGLQAAIADRLNRTDLTTQIVDCITLCEAQIQRRLAKEGFTGAVTRATNTISLEYEDAPTDVSVLLSLTITAGNYAGSEIKLATAEGIEILRDTQNLGAGVPQYFAPIGSEFRFYPVPDATYTTELQYQSLFEALSGSNAANWILTSHPDIYLFGSLACAADFVDDSRMGQWGALYVAAMDDLVISERAKRGSRNTPGHRTEYPLARQRTFNVYQGY